MTKCEPWQYEAACNGVRDAEDAFGLMPGQRRFINKYCAGCPTTLECIEDALIDGVLDDDSGVRGGFTSLELRVHYPTSPYISGLMRRNRARWSRQPVPDLDQSDTG